MKYLFKKWNLLFVALLVLGCSKSSDISDLSCQLQTNKTVVEVNSIDVTYSLEAEGDYKVVSFYYYDESGKVVLQNPEVPYEFTVTLTDQKTIEAGAQGSVKNGSIKVSYKATSDTAVYQGLDQCEQQSTDQ